MANLDNPSGLQPYGKIYPPNPYLLTASYATALLHNDPVVQVAAGTIERATAGAGNQVLGSVAGFWLEGTGPQLYFPASTAGTWTVYVFDNPNQEFRIQEDGDTTPLTAAARGAAADLIIAAGNTNTGISKAEIDSDTLAQTANCQLRLIGLVDDPNNAFGAYAEWRVRIHYHDFGVGTVSTAV